VPLLNTIAPPTPSTCNTKKHRLARPPRAIFGPTHHTRLPVLSKKARRSQRALTWKPGKLRVCVERSARLTAMLKLLETIPGSYCTHRCARRPFSGGALPKLAFTIVMCWASTIPYEMVHETARAGRTHYTGQWLPRARALRRVALLQRVYDLVATRHT
jgi:hypothetical protein